MKATTKTVWAIYSSDDRGYGYGDPIALYPFKAAAEASEENKNLRGYSSIQQIELLQFEEINYILEKKISKNIVINSEAVKLGLPQSCYCDYYYENGCNKSRYIVSGKSLIAHLESAKHSRSISKTIITRDEDSFYILKSDQSFTIKPFIMSRELAIQNALDKLTEEERKLLGV